MQVAWLLTNRLDQAPFLSTHKKGLKNGLFREGGGESGIRTHGRLTPTAVFKTAALNRSAISPLNCSHCARAGF